MRPTQARPDAQRTAPAKALPARRSTSPRPGCRVTAWNRGRLLCNAPSHVVPRREDRGLSTLPPGLALPLPPAAHPLRPPRTSWGASQPTYPTPPHPTRPPFVPGVEVARPLGPGVEKGTAKGCGGPDTQSGRLGLVAYRWRRRAAGCGRESKEAREDTEREPAAASETVRGLPRRYLSEAGRAREPAARAAPEHVHIWRSFRTPGAHWPAREGHVGPLARSRPPPAPPPTAPPALPPGAGDPQNETPH